MFTSFTSQYSSSKMYIVITVLVSLASLSDEHELNDAFWLESLAKVSYPYYPSKTKVASSAGPRRTRAKVFSLMITRGHVLLPWTRPGFHVQ